MKRKILTGILASTMILSMATTSFATANPVEGTAVLASTLSTAPESDFLASDGKIWDYVGDGGDVVIPSTIDGVPVTAIESEAIMWCETLTSIVIPASVTYIGESAFTGCSNLTSVTIGNGDIKFNRYSFELTPWKTSEEFLVTDSGKLLTYNGDDKDVVLPDYVTAIGAFAFNENSNVTSITLPSSVTKIHTEALWNCGSLETLFLSSAFTEIEAYVNNYCPITTIYYEGTEEQREKIKIHDGDINDWVFEATWIYNSTGLPPDTTPDTTPEPETTPTAPSYDSWAASFVQFSDANGLTVDSLGMDYTKSITRLQIADLLVNMVEKASGTILETGDETFTDTSSEAVSKAAAAGIIGGKGNGIFDPDNTATRQEISIMIVRAIEKLEELTGKTFVDHSLTTLEGYSDFADTAVWAQDFVAILANNGIMAGSNKKLTPLSPTTIQECLVLNNNLFNLGE